MPALSPTMESGTIGKTVEFSSSHILTVNFLTYCWVFFNLASWRVAEGDSFQPGDSLAEIQTDKASMAFEAQDAGYVAKLLVKAGDGTDIKIGSPIMVTVEEKEYVAAFNDFVIHSSDSADVKTAPESKPPVSSPMPTATPTEVKAVPSTPSPSIPAVKAESQVPTEQPSIPLADKISPTPAGHAAIPSITASAVSTPTSILVPTVGPSWGNIARVMSPLSKILSAEQKKYIEKFGSTGQLPL